MRGPLLRLSGDEEDASGLGVVVQGDWFSGSRIGTLVCVPLTSDLRWAEVPGNVVLPGTDVVLGW